MWKHNNEGAPHNRKSGPTNQQQTTDKPDLQQHASLPFHPRRKHIKQILVSSVPKFFFSKCVGRLHLLGFFHNFNFFFFFFSFNFLNNVFNAFLSGFLLSLFIFFSVFYLSLFRLLFFCFFSYLSPFILYSVQPYIVFFLLYTCWIKRVFLHTKYCIIHLKFKYTWGLSLPHHIFRSVEINVVEASSKRLVSIRRDKHESLNM